MSIKSHMTNGHEGHKERVISRETAARLARFHSLMLHVIIGAAGLYSITGVIRYYLGIPEAVDFGVLGYFNLDTVATIVGALFGIITGLVVNKRLPYQ